MSTSQHPRRRSPNGQRREMTVSPDTLLSTLKTPTFHGHTAISSFDNLEHPSPRRSVTATHALEALIDPRRVELARRLENVDNTLAGTAQPDASVLNDRDALPLPRFLLDHQAGQRCAPQPSPDRMQIEKELAHTTIHDHDSDSGLGTSVGMRPLAIEPAATIVYNLPVDDPRRRDLVLMPPPPPRNANADIKDTASIVGSDCSLTDSSPVLTSKHSFSQTSVRKIKQNILERILVSKTLECFHPLAEKVSQAIDAGSISTLREVERNLLTLAPVSDKSLPFVASFVEDAPILIRGIQALAIGAEAYSVLAWIVIRGVWALWNTSFIPKDELSRSPDRPYTILHFRNLLSDIHRYAALIADSRAKQARGEPLDEMDYTVYVHSVNEFDHTSITMDSFNSILIHSGEELVTKGGISRTGEPLELFRQKNGKTIPLSLMTEFSPTGLKRTQDEAELDTSLSMARRRKSDNPVEEIFKCKHCTRHFTRACDLTKHEKTHTRPFKCNTEGCAYRTRGFPTEKERDRHENDKHSLNPPMYKCTECDYESKRESNCKQHMEKTHNWTYVRSKGNGKGKATGAPSVSGPSPSTHASTSNNVSPSTPFTPFTPASALTSSSMQSFPDFGQLQPQELPGYLYPAVGAEDFTYSGYGAGLDPSYSGMDMGMDPPMFPNQAGDMVGDFPLFGQDTSAFDSAWAETIDAQQRQEFEDMINSLMPQ